MARNGSVFRKTLSKPGLLAEVRAGFERIDDGVSGRKFQLADYLQTSGTHTILDAPFIGVRPSF